MQVLLLFAVLVVVLAPLADVIGNFMERGNSPGAKLRNTIQRDEHSPKESGK